MQEVDVGRQKSVRVLYLSTVLLLPAEHEGRVRLIACFIDQAVAYSAFCTLYMELEVVVAIGSIPQWKAISHGNALPMGRETHRTVRGMSGLAKLGLFGVIGNQSVVVCIVEDAIAHGLDSVSSGAA